MSESEGLWIIEKMWPQTAAQTLFALGVLWVDVMLPSGGSPGSLAPPARFIFFSFLLGFPAWIGNYWFDSRAISNVQGNSSQSYQSRLTGLYRVGSFVLVASLATTLEIVVYIYRGWGGNRRKIHGANLQLVPRLVGS